MTHLFLLMSLSLNSSQTSVSAARRQQQSLSSVTFSRKKPQRDRKNTKIQFSSPRLNIVAAVMNRLNNLITWLCNTLTGCIMTSAIVTDAVDVTPSDRLVLFLDSLQFVSSGSDSPSDSLQPSECRCVVCEIVLDVWASTSVSQKTKHK